MADGLFVTFEGPEGGGKTTQSGRLARRLAADGHEVVTTREPGGTPTGEQIRGVLLDPGGDDLRPETEVLLFCAARAELVARIIRPALARGAVVLCDRYADATLAYQGHGRGLALGPLRAAIDLATDGLMPDLTFLLDVPVAAGLARRRVDAAGDWNRLDGAAVEFHERVRSGYLALADAAPHRWRVIDASRPPDDVADAVWRAMRDRLGEPTAE